MTIVKPTEDRVLVKPNDAMGKTPGGILIPDTAKQKPQKGTVIAVGPGKLDDAGIIIPMRIQMGDLVLYTAYAGNIIEIDQRDFLIMSERDVLATLEEVDDEQDEVRKDGTSFT